MNTNILQNKSSAKHEEHPFYILPPPYFPFVVALMAGLFVATVALLTHKILLNEPEFILEPINKIMLLGNFLPNSVSCLSIFIIFGQTWMNDADTALMFLTALSDTHSFLNEVRSLVPFQLHQVWVFYIIFLILIEWFFLLILPFYVNSLKRWAIWTGLVWIFLNVADLLLSYGTPGFFRPTNATLNLSFIENLFLNSWDLPQYNWVTYNFAKIYFRLQTSVFTFTLISLFLNLQFTAKLVEKWPSLAVYYKKMHLSVAKQPRRLLFSVVLGAFLSPVVGEYVFNALNNVFHFTVVPVTYIIIKVLMPGDIGQFVLRCLSTTFFSGGWESFVSFICNPKTIAVAGAAGALVSPAYFWRVQRSLDNMCPAPASQPSTNSFAEGNPVILPKGSIVILPPGSDVYQAQDGSIIAKTSLISPTESSVPTSKKLDIVPNTYTKLGVGNKKF